MFVECHLRRTFVRLTSAIALSLCCFAGPGSRALAGHLELNFNSDWRFLKADPANAQSPAFDDHDWAVVSTPHTFNDTDTFNNFALPGLRGELNQWSGRTWYRKAFVAPDAWRGQKVYIEFQAVRQFGEVYLNGERLGICRNGFIPFGFDLTRHLKYGATNVLAVMCDNRFLQNPMPAGKSAEPANDNLAAFEAKVNARIPNDVNEIQADQIPWNSPQWHPAMGGIYRDVNLYVTDPLHISLPLYDFLQTEGVYVYSTDVSAKSAAVHVEVPIENGRGGGENVEARVSIVDDNGKAVARGWQRGVHIEAGGAARVQMTLKVSSPNLWQPGSPSLYRAVCSVRTGGKVVDSQEISFGIRTVRWDVNTGFFINGNHLRLHGWGQKPVDEWPGLGDAYPDWMHFYTLNLMKEAGANWVRWGHCAGGPAQIESCDRLGLMVEQPGVDGESDTVGAAWTIRAEAFRDMIVYYRNDPSIMIWEGGNQKVTDDHARELRSIMDKYDPHGSRAYAHRRASSTVAKYMDVGVGTEGGREIGNLPVVEGEYDREESPRRIWDNFSPPEFGYPEAKGQTYQLTSEQFAVNEVSQYFNKTFRPDHAGGANWIFSDSTSGGRNTTEVSRASGEVDGVRLPKEAYYVCQAMFRDDPQVHIIGHWTYPAGTKKPVYVASNCSDVELFVNGKSLGHGQNSDRFLFTFDNVTFEPGEIKAVAYYQGKAVASNSIRTAGTPVALRLTPITGPRGLQADGSDVVLIDVEAVDAAGRRCPTFQQRVDFGFNGPALWRGGYDSGKPGSINHPFLDLEGGINRVAVRSTLQPGTITITAKSQGLRPATVVIPSLPVNMEGGLTGNLPPLPMVAVKVPSKIRLDVEPPPARGQAPALAGAGRYIVSFSYSGPTTIVHVEQNVADGKNAFVDRDQPFTGLPPELVGSDWVQAADNDSTYSAVDLMQLAVKGGTTVIVAHDDRLASPEWLSRLFQRTDKHITLAGQSMSMFQHRVPADESLTLGSNTDDPGVKKAKSYVVFVSGFAAGASARN